MKRVGVCAVQGAFAEHRAMLERIGAEAAGIRGRADLKGLDALILPGGESTAQGKLLRELGLFEPMERMIADGLPVYGTCAGMILLAKTTDAATSRRWTSPCAATAMAVSLAVSSRAGSSRA